jgi:hypothetical protein
MAAEVGNWMKVGAEVGNSPLVYRTFTQERS